ncbi:uncharacterized protein LOC111915956 [Lactuca sativa]|uniref:uncharacterized protein LOC111915956 n=1 Tax=Lactuca sativa TaxID=4236 RepID=UPI0022AF7E57|nr:uncharacterized protein LOC111915956 [Lactuca sativa]
MNRLDLAHPYNDDNDEDDLYVTMMYRYYTDNLLQSDPTPLLTRRTTLNRDRGEGHRRLVNDYFAENCVYQPSDFKRRFRLRKKVFERIANAMEARYEFFQMRYDARGKRGFTGLQKCVAAIKLMAMGESPDSVHDYMRMYEKTARESLYLLARGVVETFGDQYLIKPSLHDTQQLYAAHEERHGFPDMLGSIDCTHWKWRNCPVAWKGKAPDAPFTVNGNEYKFGYYLTDEIYPQYSTFVKAFRHPIDPRDKYFKRGQEGARKEVEHAFGIKDAILQRIRLWSQDMQFQPGTSEYLNKVVDIQDQRKHKQLREDLADYIFVGHENEDE